MTEEIKEILNNDIPIFVIDSDGYTIDITETIHNVITNLQQENEKLKYNARGQVNDYFKDKYADEVLKSAELQKTIYKAIEHIKESLYILKGDSDVPITTGNVRNRYLKPVLNILNRSGESETNSIIYSDEDVKQENSIESAIEKIWDKMVVDEYFKQLKVLKELKESDENE